MDEARALFIYSDGTIRHLDVPWAPTILLYERESERMPIVRDARTFFSEPEHLWVLTFKLAYIAGEPPNIRRHYHQISEEQRR